MRWFAVLVFIVPLAATGKPKVRFGRDAPLGEDFRCVATSCADGAPSLLERARVLAKTFNRLDVRFGPKAAFLLDVGVLMSAYAQARRAYDTVACCFPVTAASVIALCERGHLTDSYRETNELLPRVG